MAGNEKSNDRTVMVTGATGYLGSEIVARLLERERRAILCIVRGASADEAKLRVRDAVTDALGRRLEPHETERLRCVRGDIETAYFGLAPTVHDSLARGVEEVFHCAASTRLDRALRDARWTNVRGVQTVYAFAAQAASHGRFRRLHHVSTAYVVGKASGSILAGPLSERTSQSSFRNSYEQSKAEGELWLQNRSLLPTTIYRPTVIVGDSKSGRTTSWTAVHYAMNLMVSNWLKFTPGDGSSRLDCVPGDFVADAILALGSLAETAGEVLHVTSGEDALSVYELVEQTLCGIRRHGGGPEIYVPKVLDAWRWRLLSLAARCFVSGRKRRALEGYRKCEPYTRLGCVFDNRRERRLLREAGVRIPHPSAFFPRTVDFAIRHRFARDSQPGPRFSGVRENAMMARRLVAGPGLSSSNRF